MIRLIPTIVSLIVGAVIGGAFSVLENHLVKGVMVPAALILPIVSGCIISFSIYLCFVLAVRKKEIENNLEYHDALLGTITKTAPVGIGLVCDRAFVHVNDHFCRMLGYNREELIGQPTGILYPSTREFQSGLESRRSQMMEFGTGSVDTVVKRKDGTTRDVIINSTPLDRDDWQKGIAFTILDISRRKKAENELKESYKELERRKDAYKEAHRLEQLANIERSNFQANMSHEIRTPLNGILGMLQVLQMNLKNRENLELVDDAMTSCRRLANLLNDILEISRLQAGKVIISNYPFDLADIFNATKSLFKLSLRQKNLDFNIEISKDLPAILVGDDRKLTQIINNLVGNAVKFTDSGEINLEAWPLPTDSDSGICRILFSVSDTGIGIPVDKLDHIFNSYSQADGSLTRSYEGAGLGLTIVKNLLDVLGGKISIASEPELGTAIHFCLEFKVPSPGIDY